MKKAKVKEKDLLKLILDWLTAKNIFHYRQNSGALETKSGGFVRFGTKGAPDVVAVAGGRYIGIECKGTGNTQSDHQRAFQSELEASGGLYVLAYDLSDVEFIEKYKQTR